MEERPLTAGVIEQSPPPVKVESKEALLQTSFEEQNNETKAAEPEVVMRFEVAVGQTPLNRSLVD